MEDHKTEIYKATYITATNAVWVVHALNSCVISSLLPPLSTSSPMAEVTAGLLGAAATVGAAQLTAASNFTGRHESSHREVIMERRRNTDEFFANLRGGDVTPDEETEFLRTRAECVPRLRKQSLRLTPM
jgi:hypothetical protein